MKFLNVLRMSLVVVASVAVLAACGGGGPVGSSISIAITEPAETTNVSVATSIIVTITDPDDIGITEPASWSDFFTLHAAGSEVNLCSDDNIVFDSANTPQTITCNPGILAEYVQYATSISGLTDANGNRIDPAALAFTTGAPMP